MYSHSDNKYLTTAVYAARLAGDVILRNLGKISKEDIGIKHASDFVTRVDRESEQIIINKIKERFPDHKFLAEETMSEASEGFRWIIDPLDGTTNYIHEYPVFSVSIALEYKPPSTLPTGQAGPFNKGGMGGPGGEIIAGVVFDPVRGELFTAEKDCGSFLNGHPVRISYASRLENSLISTGFPFRRKDLIDQYLKLFRNIFSKVGDIRRAGSAALDLAYLACGRCDGFFEIGLGAWDMAAGSLLIKEAGGIVTDFGGGNDFLGSGNIVAANPAIHGAILTEVKSVLAEIIDK
ncbi:MAG: inositol monophosphatase [Nitrospirae bacterium]|nr:inositol monophosphatase [Nitrospirota bacterium]